MVNDACFTVSFFGLIICGVCLGDRVLKSAGGHPIISEYDGIGLGDGSFQVVFVCYQQLGSLDFWSTRVQINVYWLPLQINMSLVAFLGHLFC